MVICNRMINQYNHFDIHDDRAIYGKFSTYILITNQRICCSCNAAKSISTEVSAEYICGRLAKEASFRHLIKFISGTSSKQMICLSENHPSCILECCPVHISMANLVYRWLGWTSGTLLGHSWDILASAKW